MLLQHRRTMNVLEESAEPTADKRGFILHLNGNTNK